VAVVILHVHKYEKKKVTRKFKSGGLHERHVVATWKLGNHLQHSLIDTGKPRTTIGIAYNEHNYTVLHLILKSFCNAGLITVFFGLKQVVIKYIFFWVFPRRQIVLGRRFGTLCQFHLQRLGVEYTLHPAVEDGTDTGFRNVGQVQYPKEHIQYSIHGESLKSRSSNKVHPMKGHEGPEGEERYSSTLSLTSAVNEGGWSTPRPGRSTPEKDPVPNV